MMLSTHTIPETHTSAKSHPAFRIVASASRTAFPPGSLRIGELAGLTAAQEADRKRERQFDHAEFATLRQKP